MKLLTRYGLRTLAVISGLILISACATLIPNEYLITQQKLLSKLQSTFPLKQDLGNGLLSATLDTPLLGFDVMHNRISLATNYSAYSILSGTLQGEVMMSGALCYDAAQQAIYLQQPQIDKLSILQDERYTEMLRPVLNTILVEYLRTHALYRFQPEELRFAGTDIDITGIEVVQSGVNVQLAPKPRKP